MKDEQILAALRELFHSKKSRTDMRIREVCTAASVRIANLEFEVRKLRKELGVEKAKDFREDMGR